MLQVALLPLEFGWIGATIARIFSGVPVALTFLVLAGRAEATPPDPTSLWSTKNDESIIEIAPCGQFYCGTMVWLAEPNDKSGNPKTDHANADPSLRDRPLLGLPLLIDLAPDKNQWRGKAYNPDDGKLYEVAFKLGAGKALGDKAEIRGCVLKIFCRSETFTRVLALPNAVTAPVAPVQDKPKPTPKASSSKP